MKNILFSQWKKNLSAGKDERGFALVLTMVMLAVLSVLGTMVLNTTDTELAITTNTRISSDVFMAAELATEFSKNKIISDPNSISETTDYDLTNDTDLAGLIPDNVELVSTARNEIDFYTGMVPAEMQKNSSTDAYQTNIYRTSNSASTNGGEAAYYRVSVDVKKNNRSSARVETVFVNQGNQVF